MIQSSEASCIEWLVISSLGDEETIRLQENKRISLHCVQNLNICKHVYTFIHKLKL